MSEKIYQLVTDQIVARLEAGTVPWRMSWSTVGRPRNLVSDKPYRGINVWLLTAHGYGSPYWLTYRQAEGLGGHVRKGEHGQVIVFWKQLEVDDKEREGKTKKIPMLKFSRVFNADQCDEVKMPAGREVAEPETRDRTERIEAAEAVLAGYPDGPMLAHRGSQPFYRPATDTVTVPEQARFTCDEEYYSTLFHELVHSTGHPKRLNRFTPAAYGSHAYGREELVAEMGAAFLCGHAGIEVTFDNSAAYLAGWIKTIRSDIKAVVAAGGQAQRAADHILGVAREEERAA